MSNVYRTYLQARPLQTLENIFHEGQMWEQDGTLPEGACLRDHANIVRQSYMSEGTALVMIMHGLLTETWRELAIRRLSALSQIKAAVGSVLP